MKSPPRTVDPPDRALVYEGRDLGIELMKLTPPEHIHQVLEAMMVVMHRAVPLPPKHGTLRPLPQTSWRVGIWSRHDGYVGERYVAVPNDMAMVSVFVPGGGCLFAVAPEDLLPTISGEVPTNSRALPQLLDVYAESPDALDPQASEVVRALQRRVRNAAFQELALVGPRRSVEQIVYDVGRGAELDRRLAGDPDPEATLWRHLAGVARPGADAPNGT